MAKAYFRSAFGESKTSLALSVADCQSGAALMDGRFLCAFEFEVWAFRVSMDFLGRLVAR